MLTAFAADEIAAEQRQVDRVYARREVIKAGTAEIEAAGYQMARAGTHGALVERDAMVYHAARRRRLLDAQHDGLVFGRLDLRGGETRYVGRIGLRDEDARTLVIDWRAPPAPPFYPAPPGDPMGAGRRRMIQSPGGKGVGGEGDLLGPQAGPPDLPVSR